MLSPLWNKLFWLLYYSLFADKPRIVISNSVVRATAGHFVGCSAEGFPPVNISILRRSVSLATGIGTAMIQVFEEATYTCVASNEAGTDTRDLSVIISGKVLIFIWGTRTRGQFSFTGFLIEPSRVIALCSLARKLLKLNELHSVQEY